MASHLKELGQAFKIAEHAAPGFSDDLLKRTVSYITYHYINKTNTHS